MQQAIKGHAGGGATPSPAPLKLPWLGKAALNLALPFRSCYNQGKAPLPQLALPKLLWLGEAPLTQS